MLFAQFWQWLSLRLANYVSVHVAATAAAIEPAAVSLAVIYVMLWGYLHLKGAIQEPVITGAMRIARLAVVFGVGLRLWQYNEVLVDTFMEAPVELAAALAGAADPVATIDALWEQGGARGGDPVGQGRRAQRRGRLLPRGGDRLPADGCGVRVHAVSDGAGAGGARAAAGGRAGVHRAAAVREHADASSRRGWRSSRTTRWWVCSRC